MAPVVLVPLVGIAALAAIAMLVHRAERRHAERTMAERLAKARRVGGQWRLLRARRRWLRG